VPYRLEIKASAAREIAVLHRRAQRRVVAGIEFLADEPRPRGARKLSGSEAAYRVRVGDNRIVYCVEDDVLTVFVVRVGHRKDVYRRK
jgi:mRNA interferase RelE/StbE